MPEPVRALYDGIQQISRNGNSCSIHIRRPFLDALDLRQGDVVRVRVVDGALVIRPLKQILNAGAAALEDRDRTASDQVTA